MTMKNIFNLLVFIASAVYFSLAISLPFMKDGVPGSGFLPKMIGVLLIVLTGYDLVRNYKKNKEDSFNLTYLRDLSLLSLACLAYAFLFNILGSLVSTALFVFIVLTLLSKKTWKRNIITTIIFSAFIFLLFEIALNVGLPMGIFES
ncbi:tripartite tricarboxylate transporter TctB family protein [Lysinibacillus yapensis]|uniref:Tripartite tricarboxylate transporter TctB family protein n=1 Tax=Ureibacillus yapensis TaxID=2304605 RepID=A0A396S6Z4_9BACL|nr:tripartite tricarboxylate transporter TctB family protein [Lysinibacillus yapensis]RHW35899.1 tripartite tricarboxylate transporter TctB family protein [Lysinibacillus yapensis]